MLLFSPIGFVNDGISYPSEFAFVYCVEIYKVQITGLEEWNYVPHIRLVAQPVEHFFLWLPPFLILE
jgi:hypothetical protein